MPSTTREKMIAGAVDLLSRRGVHATSLRNVVQHTATPRGSLGHHFPGGKQQLLEEAVRYAAVSVAKPLQALMSERGAVDGLKAFVAWWRRILEASGFEAGCPVLAVAVEPVASEDDPGSDEVRAADRLLDLADEAFRAWAGILAAALRRQGVPAARAQRLAALAVSSIEGALVMCRAARNAQALDDVQRELETVLRGAIEA